MQADNTENAFRAIYARSRRQVMDWSLVLASQHIESEILRDERGWNLSVTNADYERACQAIDLYRIENRGWNWKQKLPVSGLVFHWGSVFWVIAILWLSFWSTGDKKLVEEGLMNNRAVAAGEWWRLFTAITLHGDYAHLAANATTGFLFIGLAMARFGIGMALLASYLAGAGGNVLGFALYDQTHRGLGASGMVMGALGLLAVLPFYFLQRRKMAAQVILRGLFAGMAMFILMGTTPGTDVLAHLGGFLFGILLGAGLNLVPETIKDSVLDKMCALLVAVMVIFTWGLALG